jgi:hypothetical protein
MVFFVRASSSLQRRKLCACIIISWDMNTHLDKNLHIIIIRDNVIAWVGGGVIAHCLSLPLHHNQGSAGEVYFCSLLL